MRPNQTFYNNMSNDNPGDLPIPYIIQIDTSKEGDGTNTQYRIYAEGKYNVDVYELDDTFIKSFNALVDTQTLELDNSGEYILKITEYSKGSWSRIYSNSYNYKLQKLLQWGNNKWSSCEKMFYNCREFTSVAIDTPDTSNVTNMTSMFISAYAFNSPLNFDTSNVTNMSNMFYNAQAFNWRLNFDTSNVTNMSNMFNYATSFNQDLSSWCVSQITSKPPTFDDYAPAWSKPRPNWGAPC